MARKPSTRINKYISESGLCSRREADRYVEQGNVQLNGRRATTGDQVYPGDVVKVNGQLIEPQEAEDLVCIALNKPVGIVSTTEPSEKANIVDFVKHGVRIFPIGRLDKDSQGLIFLTNNGDLVNKILRASNNHEKEYRVTVDKPITDDFIAGMAAGVPILGQVTKRCRVVKESTFDFSITLVQGLNRQIRRMCEVFGYEVTRLERIRIMNVTLKGLALGDWRDLTPSEVETLIALTEDSSAEAQETRRPGAGKRAAGKRRSTARGAAPRSAKMSSGAGRSTSGKKAAGGKQVAAKPAGAKPSPKQRAAKPSVKKTGKGAAKGGHAQAAGKQTAKGARGQRQAGPSQKPGGRSAKPGKPGRGRGSKSGR
ncbi:23S rRNA pseudouridine(2604) synthase RluF [Halomonas campisalis]|uniref:Pseudouridine synthase n=1 Tax=Billgrantia campisalis TaxID=74661 RepID=A0ABS9P650_9GAMM|nr:23S rRNA pseudouridine(2604) synthase RluF [Halomonas campisalis]MCG6657244.1 23S rRNA pseudouridine(2604) synthase RluF [Halomonas campisalis]MDR5862430.1 23S rRNA pseudouridine(2604) synthase RluF [Halomonas campisalis]